MKEVSYKKKDGTKTAYIETSRNMNKVTEEEVRRIKDSVYFFRNLGCSERITKGYTCVGYVMTKLVSKSSDRDLKVVRRFKYELKEV